MDQLSELIPYLLAYKYVGVFLLSYLTSVIVPLPGAAILLIVGTLSHREYLNLYLSFLTAFSATVLGDVTGYFFMRRFGTDKRLARYRQNNRVFRFIEKYIHTHPFSTIIISRFVGFSTTAANGISGFTKMPFRTFLLADSIGNGLCVAFYLSIGYGVGSIWSQANVLFVASGTVLICAVLYAPIAIASYVLRDRSTEEHR